jgi:hypothetical protein
MKEHALYELTGLVGIAGHLNEHNETIVRVGVTLEYAVIAIINICIDHRVAVCFHDENIRQRGFGRNR